MSKKEDNIKVLIEKARRGDIGELPSLTRAYSRWLRSSLAEEQTQSSVRRFVEKFLQNLNKLVRQIEKTQNADAKTRAVQILSRLVETIYNTGDSGTAIKYIKRLTPGIEKIHEDKAGVKSLREIIDLLAELPIQTAVQSQSENNMELALTTKKRAGCVGGGGGKVKKKKKKKKKKKTAGSSRVARTRGDGGGGGGGGGAVEMLELPKKRRKKEEESNQEEESDKKEENS